MPLLVGLGHSSASSRSSGWDSTPYTEVGSRRRVFRTRFHSQTTDDDVETTMTVVEGGENAVEGRVERGGVRKVRGDGGCG